MSDTNAEFRRQLRGILKMLMTSDDVLILSTRFYPPAQMRTFTGWAEGSLNIGWVQKVDEDDARHPEP